MIDNEKEFLKALSCLSRKYNLKISGCGCCGSPSVDEMSEQDHHPDAGYCYVDSLQWMSPDNYYWDMEDYMYKDEVVR